MTVHDPIPHQCYEIGASDKQVNRGFNNTVFTAEPYADSNCRTSLGHEVPANSGFNFHEPVESVAFHSAHS
jgi:hypothetical protein